MCNLEPVEPTSIIIRNGEVALDDEVDVASRTSRNENEEMQVDECLGFLFELCCIVVLSLGFLLLVA